ncbi:transposase [Amycolatopsis sp. NPDC047767]|uniref:transposase n=1 Tax=Amycolatopsis sp. NPDC047767 TaxID=3156765 RepID=UPI003456D560
MARTRWSKVPIEDKVRVVLAMLSGELTEAEAARRHGASPMSVSTWKQTFLDGGTKA